MLDHIPLNDTDRNVAAIDADQVVSDLAAAVPFVCHWFFGTLIALVIAYLDNPTYNLEHLDITLVVCSVFGLFLSAVSMVLAMVVPWPYSWVAKLWLGCRHGL